MNTVNFSVQLTKSERKALDQLARRAPGRPSCGAYVRVLILEEVKRNGLSTLSEVGSTSPHPTDDTAPAGTRP